MKKLGVLCSNREYFTKYIQWIHEEDGKQFDLVGCLSDDKTRYEKEVLNFKNYNDDIFSKCDIILSLGYWKIIPKNVIDAVPMGILNLHHSYNLKYRGRHTCSWALINREQVHGSTLHYMSPTLDYGPILASECVQILNSDTAETLFNKVDNIGFKLVKENLNRALERNLFHELSWPTGEYFSYRERDLKQQVLYPIDDARFERNVRALTFSGKPLPYVITNGKKIYLKLDESC